MAGNFLEETSVGKVVQHKPFLICVPDTATVHDALQLMRKHGVTAMPVVAPPGKWLGAGASTITDGIHHYIGVISMVDVAIHIASSDDYFPQPRVEEFGIHETRPRGYPLAAGGSPEGRLSSSVVDLIGQTDEGMSLWTYSHTASLVDVMEPLSKGVHRLLIHFPPNEIDPHKDSSGWHDSPRPSSPTSIITLPSAPSNLLAHRSTSFRFLSQTDIVTFLLNNVDYLLPALVQTPICDLGLVNPVANPPLAIPYFLSVLDALHLMRSSSPVLAALPVVDPFNSTTSSIDTTASRSSETSASSPTSSHPPSISRSPERSSIHEDLLSRMKREGFQPHGNRGWVHGGKLLGTFSASDLRVLDADTLAKLPTMQVADFFRLIPTLSAADKPIRPIVSCRPSAPLVAAMAVAVDNHVHRIWVTDDDSNGGGGEQRLVGVVSLSDIIHVCRGGGSGGGGG